MSVNSKSSNSASSYCVSCKNCPCYTIFPKKCHCGMKPVIYTSMTMTNPIRRFAKCGNQGTVADCGFYEWVDDHLCPFIRTRVRSLISRNEFLEGEMVGFSRMRNDMEDQKEVNKALVEKNNRLKQVILNYETRDQFVRWMGVCLAVVAFVAWLLLRF